MTIAIALLFMGDTTPPPPVARPNALDRTDPHFVRCEHSAGAGRIFHKTFKICRTNLAWRTIMELQRKADTRHLVVRRRGIGKSAAGLPTGNEPVGLPPGRLGGGGLQRAGGSTGLPKTSHGAVRHGTQHRREVRSLAYPRRNAKLRVGRQISLAESAVKRRRG